MSNEEHIEEILINAYESGVYNQILSEVENLLKTNTKMLFSDAVVQVFHKYVEEGLVHQV